MGRKTWESLPPSSCPLPQRRNFILTSAKEYRPAFNSKITDFGTPAPLVFDSIPNVFEYVEGQEDIGEVFVIGGSSIFDECLTTYKEKCKLVFTTRINKNFPEADVFMPTLPESDWAPVFVSET
jgi:dihydrofolate reductase